MTDLVERYRDLEREAAALRAERDALLGLCVAAEPDSTGFATFEGWHPEEDGDIDARLTSRRTREDGLAAVRRAAGLDAKNGGELI